MPTLARHRGSGRRHHRALKRCDDLHAAQHPGVCDQHQAGHPGFRPQGNGITRAYSKAAAFASPYTPVTTAIDIKSAYDSKNGAPKVFFKYFYVNAATGEKSGEKMASAVLSA